MQRPICNLHFLVAKLDHRHIQLALLVVILALFVLGAGAPTAHGGAGG